MGESTTVIHKCGLPLTVYLEIDGKASQRECVPGYFTVPCCLSTICCKGALEKTAKNAAAIQGGAPQNVEIRDGALSATSSDGRHCGGYSTPCVGP